MKSRAVDSINDTEKEVMLLVAQGFTTKEIAALTFASIRTVDGRRKSALEKLGAKNTAHGIALLYQFKIFT